MIDHIHTMLAPWCCYLLKRERAFAWCMTCLHIARVLTFLVVMGVTWRIFRLSMYRDSWALTCSTICARRAVTVRDRWWYDNLRDRVVARATQRLCDISRMCFLRLFLEFVWISLSMSRISSLLTARWLWYTHATTHDTSNRGYDPCDALSHCGIVILNGYHNRHCNIANVQVTCMITCQFRIVISSIITVQIVNRHSYRGKMMDEASKNRADEAPPGQEAVESGMLHNYTSS